MSREDHGGAQHDAVVRGVVFVDRPAGEQRVHPAHERPRERADDGERDDAEHGGDARLDAALEARSLVGLGRAARFHGPP